MGSQRSLAKLQHMLRRVTVDGYVLVSNCTGGSCDTRCLSGKDVTGVESMTARNECGNIATPSLASY